MLVAGNKCDLTTDEEVARFAAFAEEQGYAFFPMMAAIAHGTQELMEACAKALAKLPPLRVFEAEPEPLPDLSVPREPKITVQDGVYMVEADWLLPILRTVDMEEYDSLQYMERVLQQSGVIQALRDAGIQEGDTVSLYDFEFEFVN